MIDVTKIFRLTGGFAPYEYTWTADDDCVSFDLVTSTTDDGYIQVTLSYIDDTCIDNTTITLNATDSQGCPFEEEVTITNPCGDFVVNPISLNPPYEFTVNAASPGCASVDFKWTFDTQLFNLVSQVDNNFTSTLQLSLKTSTPPATATIRVTATDCDKCEKTVIYTYTFCIPQAENIVLPLFKVGTVYISQNYELVEPDNCIGAEFDWTTVVFSLPFGVTATKISTKTYRFSVSSPTQSSYSGTYNFKTTEGIKSTNGTVLLTISAESDKTIQVSDKVWTLDCDDLAGDIIELNIEDELVITPGFEVDWSTFQTVQPPPFLSPNIELSTNIDGDHVILYTIPTPLSPDSFSWIICDTEGNCSDNITYTIIDCVQPPTANNDSADVACGESVVIDLTSNDLGNGSIINDGSITIITGPTKGTVVVNIDGTVTYTAYPGVSGNDTFTYTVKNSGGETSNTATVTVDITCAGEDANVILCN